MARESGALLALAPLLAGFGPRVLGELALPLVGLSARHALIVLGGAYAISGLLLALLPRVGRVLALLSTAAAGALTVVSPAFGPMGALLVGSVFVGLWYELSSRGAPRVSVRNHGPIAAARGAAGVLLAALALAILGGLSPGRGEVLAVAISASVVAALVVVALIRVERAPSWRRSALRLLGGLGALFGVLPATLAVLSLAAPAAALWFSLPLAALTLLALREQGRERSLLGALLDGVTSHPARLLVGTFLALCVLGTALLGLPASRVDHSLTPLDIAFTATSVVCVNGLMVTDLATQFTAVGQGITLVLIQVGGLGIMSFSTVVAAALGRRLSLRQEAAMADLLLADGRGHLGQSLRRLLGVTLIAEALGAAVLFPLFLWHGEEPGAALFRAVFTAVSAFCNAGLTLSPTSLMPYAESELVLHVIALLVILGGLSPLVVTELPRLVRRRVVSLQTRIVTLTTLVLLVSGALVLLALEGSHAFAHLTLRERLTAAWFHSVTLRTAGFNAVDLASLREGTLWVMCVFMFIGGSPGGTAGGIKTTTVATLMIAVMGAMRGRWEAVAFGRQLPNHTVYKAAAITTMALTLVVVGVVALSVTQDAPFMPMLFEVVAALSTAGLSAGVTQEIDWVGKVVLMAYMFIGRVGPLTLFLFLSERSVPGSWRLPEEDVDVG
ncbi:MAG: hypothetical protein KIT72_01610 [Polyangiaceae bacterium]|nr:hypothetical protein [Polyangiaceae bacterium]